MSETILKEEERVAFALRSLYRRYGYLPYKMNKFETYDLYASNKDFLVGDGVITFNDTDGKLLALKPDVTLSIIKNTAENTGKQKVYYNENVYRISGETKQFKEIMQAGLECIGEVDAYDVFETVSLAAGSLCAISENFVLDISHLGIVSAVLSSFGLSDKYNREIMRKIAEKNLHDTQALCENYGVSAENTDKLLSVIRSYGDMKTVLDKLAPLCTAGEAKTAYDELYTLYTLLKDSEYADRIRIDFSVVNDMKYYNGIVFKGFVDGIPEGVLSGGQYDRLMKRMGRNARAIGFAVYLDLLDGFGKKKSETDVDVIVLYDEKTPVETVKTNVQLLVAMGKTVSAQKALGKRRYADVVDLRGGEQ